MAKRAPRWALWTALGVAIGLALGVAIGWWFWPVTYTNTSPDALRDDYHDDYVLMVAATYAVEHDLQEARSRLESLNPSAPTAPVVDLKERLIAEGGSEQDIARLTDLARALDAPEAPSGLGSEG